MRNHFDPFWIKQHLGNHFSNIVFANQLFKSLKAVIENLWSYYIL